MVWSIVLSNTINLNMQREQDIRKCTNSSPWIPQLIKTFYTATSHNKGQPVKFPYFRSPLFLDVIYGQNVAVRVLTMTNSTAMVIIYLLFYLALPSNPIASIPTPTLYFFFFISKCYKPFEYNKIWNKWLTIKKSLSDNTPYPRLYYISICEATSHQNVWIINHRIYSAIIRNILCGFAMHEVEDRSVYGMMVRAWDVFYFMLKWNATSKSERKFIKIEKKPIDRKTKI